MYTINGKFIPNNSDKKFKLLGVKPVITDLELPTITGKENNLESLQKGSIIHKTVRKIIQPMIQPGMKLSELTEKIETTIKNILGNSKYCTNSGIGFPPSLSISDCAAHFNPDKKLDKVLKCNDNIKVDFGVEINGWIVDCAFTGYFDEKYDPLHQAVKEATFTGIKNAGVGVYIKDWAKDIQEVMESYEMEYNGDIVPIYSVKNLGGHNILKGHIHGGIFLPSFHYPLYPKLLRFDNGVYAIETFGCVGSDNVVENPEKNTIYMWKNHNYEHLLKSNIIKKNSNRIYNKFRTLPFCNRFVDNIISKKPRTTLKNLVKKNIITPYPPFYSDNGGMTAQYEHTIVLKNDKKYVVSQGEDY